MAERNCPKLTRRVVLRSSALSATLAFGGIAAGESDDFESYDGYPGDPEIPKSLPPGYTHEEYIEEKKKAKTADDSLWPASKVTTPSDVNGGSE